MSGIYIHIPYCKKKCSYCSFFSTADILSMPFYIQALVREIQLRKNELIQPIQTIYFGGGTPSLLDVKSIQSILEAIYLHYDCSQVQEITLEGNPDSLTRSYLSDIKKYTPINRLSIGVQSFHDEDLKRLNRLHSAYEAQKSLDEAVCLGFANINVDLIYGISGSSSKIWEENLDYFFSKSLAHLSAYALTVEEGSLLKKQIEKGMIDAEKEEVVLEQYQILQSKILEKGYIGYETSNYCIPEKYSKHNSNYWKMTPYLGLGASAHSYNGKSRQWNISHLPNYIKAKTIEDFIQGQECLSSKDQLNEYLMLSLRTIWGISKDEFAKFPTDHVIAVKNKLQTWKNEGYVLENDSTFSLSEKGKLFADGIASSLFC